MKKIALQSVRLALRLMPPSMKKKLQTNEKLTEFYSVSLRRSGLFYGVPSKRVRKKLYTNYLQEESKTLTALSSERGPQLQCVIFPVEGADTQVTLDSLREAGIKRIVCIGTETWETYRTASSFNESTQYLDELLPTLLLNAGDTVNKHCASVLGSELKKADIVYCDSDKIENGLRRSPHFLPDWNPEYQFASGYVSSGVLIKTQHLSLVKHAPSTIGGIVSSLWLQDPSIKIHHAAFVLLHCNTACDVAKKTTSDIHRLLELSSDAQVLTNQEIALNHVQWPVLANPLVSLIIPTKNGKELVKACIESIFEKTTYKNFEILLIDNGSDEPESLDYFDSLKQHPKITVLDYPGVFNYSAINNFGVHHARGEVVGLINNDIEVIKPEWLTYMVGHALRDDVGCVGAKLLYSDGRIQHGGVVLGYGGGAGHAHKYFPRYHPGYMNRLLATQNFSAVTAACLLVKKALFDKVGGLNEADLAVAFNDVDFCLRVKETGVRNVFCAEAELFHHESVSRGLDISPEKAARFNRELEYLKTTWGKYIAHDPAYSPNLTLKRENFSIKTKEEFAAMKR